MAITAQMVKDLREMTGVGMMDCKNALNATDGEMEAAVDWLRAKGLAKAAKKSSRVASEGLIGIAVSGVTGSVVEVNAETDFVGRNEEFQEMVSTIATLGLEGAADVDALNAMTYPGADQTVAERLVAAVAKIGENMQLRRSNTLTVSDGAIGAYVHNAVADGLGKIGILVGLESTGDKAVVGALGKQIAMHVAAINPLSVSPDDLDADVVARERAVFVEQAAASGKPEAIVEKMVDGRMRKYFEEVCLLSQTFVVDSDKTVQQAVDAAAEAAGAPIKVVGFVRLALGEGVEKEESDFAAEVAAAAGTQ